MFDDVWSSYVVLCVCFFLRQKTAYAVRISDWSSDVCSSVLRHDGPVGEFSVAVLDEFQGRGLARMMTAALLVHCHAEGLGMLDVQIVSENAAARRLVKSLGAAWAGEAAGVADYRLDVAAAIEALRADTGDRKGDG